VNSADGVFEEDCCTAVVSLTGSGRLMVIFFLHVDDHIQFIWREKTSHSEMRKSEVWDSYPWAVAVKSG
jgi:hypothetical protein